MHSTVKRPQSNPNSAILPLPLGILRSAAIFLKALSLPCFMTASPSLFLLEGSSTACREVLLWHCLGFYEGFWTYLGFYPSSFPCSNPRLQCLPPSWVLKYCSLRQCWMCAAQLTLSSLSTEGFLTWIHGCFTVRWWSCFTQIFW